MSSRPLLPPAPRTRRLTAALACGLAAVALAPAGPPGADARGRVVPRPVPASDQDAPYPVRSAIAVERGLAYGAGAWTALDVYRRADAGLRPAVIVLHGGGWRGGTRGHTAPLSEALARAGFVAVNVDYTLSTLWRPGFPRQLREVRSAVRFVRRNAARLGVDPRRIGAIGSSAGAHLSALLGTVGRGSLGVGARVRAAVLWSAPLDLLALDRHPLHGIVDQLVGCVPRACAGRRLDASPTHHVSPDDAPMLIVNSERELVPASQARRMAARMTRAGVRNRLWLLPGGGHARDYEHVMLGPSIAFLRRNLR